MKKIVIVDESHHVKTTLGTALKCAHMSHPIRDWILIETDIRDNKDYGFLDKENRSHEAVMNGTVHHREV